MDEILSPLEAKKKIEEEVTQKEPSDNDDEMVFAHFNTAELEMMDVWQGEQETTPVEMPDGQIIEVRSYKGFGELIKDPTVRETLLEAQHNLINNPELGMKQAEIGMAIKPKSLPPVSADSNPTIMLLAAMGKDYSNILPDTEIALIPMNVAKFFKELMGSEKINPETGFREYGFKFRKLLKPVGSILGGIAGVALAPVTGGLSLALAAGAGAGLGGLLGAKLSGESWRDSLRHGLISGVIGGATAGLGHALSGGASSVGTGTAAASNVGKAGDTILRVAPSAASTTASTAAQAAPSILSTAGQTAAQGVGQTAGQVAPQGFLETAKHFATETAPSFLKETGKSLLKPEVLVPGSLLLTTMGHKQDVKNYEDQKTHNREEKERLRKEWKENQKMEPVEFRDFSVPDREIYEPRRAFSFHSHGDQVKQKLNYVRFPSKSHPVIGPGKGQDDVIAGDAKDGDFIIDATTVAHLGDGSSTAGHKELGKLEKMFRNTDHYQNALQEKRPKVPVALSNDEYRLTHPVVAAIGNGSLERGAEKLRNLQREVRREKAAAGGELPSKAKPIEHYLGV